MPLIAFSMSLSSSGGVTYWRPHTLEDVCRNGKPAVGSRFPWPHWQGHNKS